MTPPLTAWEIADRVRRGDASAAEVTAGALARLEALDPRLQAFLATFPERAMQRAKDIDARRARGEALGPLAGVPVAIKDNMVTSFGPTTCGSKILKGFHSIYDAHVVERLESADAVIVGKTNLDEFAMGSSTENSGFAPTRNPWDQGRVPGGSSGGSAAAVAAGIVPIALGSDTGGSIRQPASHCGVVGLKPSYGRVSRYGLVAYASSLDQIGPLARDVRDAAQVLGVIAGHDPRDSTSVAAPVPEYLSALGSAPAGLRIGLPEECFGAGLDDAVSAAVHAAIEVLVAQGSRVEPIHLPHMKYAVSCYYLIAAAEASSNLARFDGVHYGHRTAAPADYVDLYSASRGEGFGAEVKRRIMLGTYALSSGYYDAYYLKALKVRTLIQRDFEDAFKRVDLIASPVAPTTAFRLGEKSADPLQMYLSDIYTLSANLAGISGISIPCGHDPAGLPIGLQLLGPGFGEEKLLAAAHWYQRSTDHHQRSAPLHP